MNDAPVPALARHQFTRGMPADYIAALAGAARHVKVPARHRLFEEGGTADRFWLIQAGRVALDMQVPGRGLVVIEALGMGDVIGWSWLYPPYQWRLGAVAMQPTQAFEIDGAKVREMCAADPGFGYELTRRFLVLVVGRLQATRSRLLDLDAHPADWP
jgi:CRP/FNR family transcriptional regulator, cyclic AMP receptor protein